MTAHVADIASYQGALTVDDLNAAGFTIVNVKVSHGLTLKSVHPNAAGMVARARALGMGVSTFHWLNASAPGAAQADHAYTRLTALGADTGAAHVVDCEDDADHATFTAYVRRMSALLGRPVWAYTGRWWWEPRGWPGAVVTPYLWAAPRAGYLGAYPGDTSPHWRAGYGGWDDLHAMQYAVAPVVGINVSMTAIRDRAVWAALTGGNIMPDWYLDKGLGKLAEWLRARYPGIVIGTIADGNHDKRSDHSPEEDGSVDALDPMIGKAFTFAECQAFIDRLVATRDRRIAYIIWNRRIISSTVQPWVWRTYTGSDPHTGHAHISANDNHENDTSDWGLDVAFKDEKIPLTVTTGKELYEPDRPEGAEVYAHHILQTAAIYGQRATSNTAVILKNQAAQTAQLALILAAAKAGDDSGEITAQGNRIVAAIEATDVTDIVADIKARLTAAGGTPELAPVLTALDALPALILERVAAAQRAAADALGGPTS